MSNFWFLIAVTAVSAKQVLRPTCGYESCPKLDTDALNVHLVPHSHDDVGWLKTVDQYYFEDVSYILSSVVSSLQQNPDRRFIQVETAYLKKWWLQQSEKRQQDFINLVESGRLEIVNGAWSMNDEAAVNYQSTIDQFELGLRFLEENIGPCARPRIGWQIDPFGHSREHASLISQMGFDGLFFARIDYRDRIKRRKDKTMEFFWKGSQNLDNSSIFTSVLYNHYSAPSGFCFDINCRDEPMVDDPESSEFNLPKRVEDFAMFIKEQAKSYPTNHILITMGDDFKYKAASVYFLNMDRLIRGFKKFPQKIGTQLINVMYSTPSCYVKAVNAYLLANNKTLNEKADDFFPYADDVHKYWTGYFTSRPLSKKLERDGNNLLQVAKQLSVISQVNPNTGDIRPLKEAIGVMQHHDAITGTERAATMESYHRSMGKAMDRTLNYTARAISSLIGSRNISLHLKSCMLNNIVFTCDDIKSYRFNIILCNPLSQNVTDIVRVPVTSSKYIVKDPKGHRIKSQTVNDTVSNHSRILAFEANLQPLGVTVYEVEKVLDDSTENTPMSSYAQKDDRWIGYENVGVEINGTSGRLKSIKMNGITLNVTQEFLYYISTHNDTGSSGAYLFRPNGTAHNCTHKALKYTVDQGEVLIEIKQYVNSWISQIIRMYKDEPHFIEFDWTVGPINVSDNDGKEIISRFTVLDLKTDGKFYTDSNGREMLERRRDFRYDYNYTNEENITANYYPVTSRIVLKDSRRGTEFAVLTDRSQGGGSLEDGQLELMVHRRCLYDDGKGVAEALNEIDENGVGIKVRGKHYVTLGPKVTTSGRSLATIQRRIALQKLLSPWTFVADGDISSVTTKRQTSFLTRALPENLHILTLEPFETKNKNGNQILIRIEHLLEKDDDQNLSRNITIDLSGIFQNITITKLTELSLDGSIEKMKLKKLEWDNQGSVKGSAVTGTTVTLRPMEILTLIAHVQYKSKQNYGILSHAKHLIKNLF